MLLAFFDKTETDILHSMGHIAFSYHSCRSETEKSSKIDLYEKNESAV